MQISNLPSSTDDNLYLTSPAAEAADWLLDIHLMMSMLEEHL